MSGHNTPFIPPLGTPSPDNAVHPPVIPVTSPTSSQASRSRPPSRGAGGPPAGWASQYPPSAAMPYFGQGHGTPYGAPFIPFTPYSQASASGGMGGYTPLPPVGPNGVSADYRGYPDYLPPPTPMMGGGGGPGIPPQGTPWHAGGGTVPLHHGAGAGAPPGSPWGMGQPASFRGWGGGGQYSAGAYPPAGWGSFSPTWGGIDLGGGWGAAAPSAPGGWPGVHPGVQPSVQEQGRRFEKESGDRLPKWTAGPHYGPVLNPFQMRVVGATLELNPLLTPVPEEGPEANKTYLRWNMLFESSLVHRSCDPLQVSWSAGRNEPATFPRLTVLKIVSDNFPWLVEVKARNLDIGVTCGEVIEALAASMDKLTSKSDYEALSGSLKRLVLEAYRYNRSRNPDVPGGKMGDGIKRVDYLGQMTAFGGLQIDPAAVGRVCGVVVPGYVTLRCDKREFMTQEEVRAQQARERAANKAPSRSSRTPSSRTSSSRSSRSGGSISVRPHTPGVDIVSPTSSESEEDTE